MGFENKERLYKMCDRGAIAEKAYRARQIAAAAGDIEVEAKYRELNDSRAFWAYIAATRPVYAYKACAEYEESEAEVQGQRRSSRIEN